jgi:hypothetical protein
LDGGHYQIIPLPQAEAATGSLLYSIIAIALMVRPVKPSVALVVEDESPVPDVLLIGFVSTFAI